MSGGLRDAATTARKYLTSEEGARFLATADAAPREVRALCHMRAWSGRRVSEALALTAERVDVAGAALTIESLKKRRRGVFRTVPVPPELATMLGLVFGLRERHDAAALRAPLWAWSRTPAWRRVRETLAAGRRGWGGQPQGAAARAGRGGRDERGVAQPGAALARPRPARDARDLRRGGR